MLDPLILAIFGAAILGITLFDDDDDHDDDHDDDAFELIEDNADTIVDDDDLDDIIDDAEDDVAGLIDDAADDVEDDVTGDQDDTGMNTAETDGNDGDDSLATLDFINEIDGTDGDDTLVGYGDGPEGRDRDTYYLDGKGGDDLLIIGDVINMPQGTDGAARMTGGEGSDTFVILSPLPTAEQYEAAHSAEQTGVVPIFPDPEFYAQQIAFFRAYPDSVDNRFYSAVTSTVIEDYNPDEDNIIVSLVTAPDAGLPDFDVSSDVSFDEDRGQFKGSFVINFDATGELDETVSRLVVYSDQEINEDDVELRVETAASLEEFEQLLEDIVQFRL
ncbi:hypothetical protein [Palleronia caenipelagi]|uniref:Calcium-binding protein n=1 Tax=Palleronia caenipelagi TaxID=2489174 RepID=A0A547QB64_9RHOB|nr:hypothetical protein [Palleronia caenipelagi]TRD23590.1 hypothetical protein FEV53_00815 [Palleronia caenipelagi]